MEDTDDFCTVEAMYVCQGNISLTEKALLEAQKEGNNPEIRRLSNALASYKIEEKTLCERHWSEEAELRKKIDAMGLEKFLENCRKTSKAGAL
jgi:hypothetical protein